MGGPRVTSGTDSKQDYATPDEFINACEKRFGDISFDLAAHSGNKKHFRYFAPTYFEEAIVLDHEWTPADNDVHGPQTGRDGITISFVKRDPKKGWIYEKKTRNDDPEAYGKDAFVHSWSEISRKFGHEHESGRALLWDNCEFNDIPRWARRHLSEMREGANSLLLTPLTTANWYRDYMAGVADVYHLSGRLSFDGKNVFAKDCMVTHYHEKATGALFLWDWQRDAIQQSWIRKS